MWNTLLSYSTRGERKLRYNYASNPPWGKKTNAWHWLKASSGHANTQQLQGTSMHSQTCGQRMSQRCLQKKALGTHRSSEYKGDMSGEPVASITTSLNCTKRKIYTFHPSIPNSVCASCPGSAKYSPSIFCTQKPNWTL